MTSVEDTIVFSGRVIINVIVLVLRNVLLCAQYLSRSFPQVSDFITTLFMIYAFYRILKRLMFVWIGLLKSALKLFMFLVLCVFAAALYIRGLLLLTKDIVFLSSLFSKLSTVDQTNNVYHGFQQALGNGFTDAMRDWLKSNLEPEMIEQHVHKLGGGLRGFVGENIEVLQNFLNDQRMYGAFDEFRNMKFD